MNHRILSLDGGGAWAMRALLNVSPKINSIQFPGANRTYTNTPKGHATIFAG
jgi:hypothetical protein